MTPRNVLAAVLLVALGGVALRSMAKLLDNPATLPPHDFVEYWCAGTLNLAGRDPYDAAAMYKLEQEIGWDIGEAVMMWNPPWTLSVAMPLAAMPWRTAQLVWLLARFAALGLAAWLLAKSYPTRPWVAPAVTFTWLPCYIALQYGQIPPLMLLGVTAFVFLEQRGHRFWAGFACVLLAVKPHLAALFWLAVALHALRTREWRIVAGGIAGGVALSVWPLLTNPHVFAHYFASAKNNPPAQWLSPTIGTWLRLYLGDEFWLQFVPMLPGLAWFAWQWWRTRRSWNWTEQTPWLIFVSFVTAPYGAWPYDLTLLVLPFVAVASQRLSVPLIAFYMLLNAGVLVCTDLVLNRPAQDFVWVAPTALAGVLLLRRKERA